MVGVPITVRASWLHGACGLSTGNQFDGMANRVACLNSCYGDWMFARQVIVVTSLGAFLSVTLAMELRRAEQRRLMVSCALGADSRILGGLTSNETYIKPCLLFCLEPASAVSFWL